MVEDDDAFETARLLATHEGIFCGMSGGAAVVGALRLAAELEKGLIVVIIPDRGDRYLAPTFLNRCVLNAHRDYGKMDIADAMKIHNDIFSKKEVEICAESNSTCDNKV